jgi:DNA mismatch repair protein MutL
MNPGGQIRLLPPEVANRIAAGEVVERPASVLKELMENAIDAGARQIVVDVTAGGTRLIRVADDGSGMSRDDALLSVERHATSKIRRAEDLEHIATLGFRGEALAAIAAVSRFRMQTRRREDLAGAEVALTGGTLQDVRDAGCPPGTLVEVRDLFFNMPARRKFLRSPQTEVVHVRQVFITYALAYPELGMTLTVDGRPLHALNPGGSLEDRLRECFGPTLLPNLRAVSFRAGAVTFRGYVSVPAASRADRAEQYVFINRRPAMAAVLTHALREAYRAVLPADRHPLVFLFVDMDPAGVDVNVHPTKKEVRFRRPAEVRDALLAAFREALRRAAEVPPATGAAAAPPPAEEEPPPEQPPLIRIEDLPAARRFRYPRLPMTGPGQESGAMPPAPDASGTAAAAPPAAPSAGADALAGAARSPWAWCRVVGQIAGLYVILETEDGFVVMDPHAAHERVLFERYMADYLNGRVESQGLLVPETVDLLPHDALQVRRNLDLLRKMGFGISGFGGDTYVVDALPACFSRAAAAGLLADVAHHLEEIGPRAGQIRLREEAIAQAACKAAVKARDRLTLPEIEELVVALASAEMPYTCPHGRPTLIYTSFNELGRKFGRA